MEDIKAFIANYCSEDELFICFDWNGKHRAEFVDRNIKFRNLVREIVLADVSAAPIELVRDLFRAETKCSRESWGIALGVGELAENLLRRGGVRYLDDYLEGKHQSFDAFCGSSFQYDLALAEMLLGEIQERIRSFPDSPKVPMWRVGEELFAGWVTDCKQQDG